MRKNPEPGVVYEGNDQYEGYCKDLADLIANHIGISYVLKLVNDSKYGGMDSSSPSGWNGMVGELIRQVIKHMKAKVFNQFHFSRKLMWLSHL